MFLVSLLTHGLFRILLLYFQVFKYLEGFQISLLLIHNSDARKFTLYYFNPLKLIETYFMIQHMIAWVSIPGALENPFASYFS